MMTRTVALADDAYEALAAVKWPQESFSQVVRRAAKELARRHVLDPARKPLLSDAEADQMVKSVRKWRDESLEPRHSWD